MILKYLSNVTTLKLDQSLCIGCRVCLDVCPHGVFAVEDGKTEIIDRDACMECGACEKNCKAGAIAVRSGVGCAAGVLSGLLNGTDPSCGCSGDNSCCC